MTLDFQSLSSTGHSATVHSSSSREAESLGQFLRELFKVPQYPSVGPLLIPMANYFRGQAGEPYMGQSENTH